MTIQNNGVEWFDVRDPAYQHMPFIVSFDWGFTDKAVAVFTLIDEANRNYIIFDVLARNKMYPSDIARLVQQKIKYYGEDRCIRKVADPSIAAKHAGNSVRDQMYSTGLQFELGNNDRQGGYMFMYALIKQQRLLAMVQPENNYLVDNNMINTKEFWDTVPNLVLDSKNKDNVADNQDDHCYDSTRYGVMALDESPYNELYSSYYN